MVVISRHHGWKKKAQTKINTEKENPLPRPERGANAVTSLLSWMLWSISCSRNHITFLSMKVVIRFQWMMLRRHRMLLVGGQKQPFSPTWGCFSAGRENALMLLYVFGRADGESNRLQNIQLFSNSFSLAIKVGWITFPICDGSQGCMQGNECLNEVLLLRNHFCLDVFQACQRYQTTKFIFAASCSADMVVSWTSGESVNGSRKIPNTATKQNVDRLRLKVRKAKLWLQKPIDREDNERPSSQLTLSALFWHPLVGVRARVCVYSCNILMTGTLISLAKWGHCFWVLKLGFKVKFKFRWKLRGWEMCHVIKSPHKDRSTKHVCVCVSVCAGWGINPGHWQGSTSAQKRA